MTGSLESKGMDRLSTGAIIHIKSINTLDGLNGIVLEDSGDSVWFVTLFGNRSKIVPDGSRHIVPRDQVYQGLHPRSNFIGQNTAEDRK